MNTFRSCILLVLTLAASPTVVADDKAATVEPRASWTNVFGGRDIAFPIQVKSARAFQGRVSWNIRVEQRTIARGETALAVEANKPIEASVRLAVPVVKEGAIFPATLTLSVFRAGQKQAEAVLDQPLWIFPEDPFADRSQWLKGLKIHLFDPEKKTGELFRKINVPFEEIENAAALSEIPQGVLILGEGVSFQDHAELSEVLTKAAARGLRVLCLAPSRGSLAIPGADNPRLPAPMRLAWRRSDIITDLDKRLDARAWVGDVKVIRSSLRLKAAEGNVVGEIVQESDAWPWLEASFPDKNGRLVVSGFGVIAAWDSGPTPRFLLSRMLEAIAPVEETRSR